MIFKYKLLCGNRAWEVSELNKCYQACKASYKNFGLKKATSLGNYLVFLVCGEK